MAYEPTVWNTGDVISAEKLNKIENGLAAGGGLPVVHISKQSNGYAINETYSELSDILGDKEIIPVNIDTFNGSILGEIARIGEGAIYVQFSSINMVNFNDPHIDVFVITISQDNTQEYYEYKCGLTQSGAIMS